MVGEAGRSVGVDVLDGVGGRRRVGDSDGLTGLHSGRQDEFDVGSGDVHGDDECCVVAVDGDGEAVLGRDGAGVQRLVVDERQCGSVDDCGAEARRRVVGGCDRPESGHGVGVPGLVFQGGALVGHRHGVGRGGGRRQLERHRAPRHCRCILKRGLDAVDGDGEVAPGGCRRLVEVLVEGQRHGRPRNGCRVQLRCRDVDIGQLGDCSVVEPGFDEVPGIGVSEFLHDFQELLRAGVGAGGALVAGAQNGEERVVAHLEAQGVKGQGAPPIDGVPVEHRLDGDLFRCWSVRGYYPVPHPLHRGV